MFKKMLYFIFVILMTFSTDLTTCYLDIFALSEVENIAASEVLTHTSTGNVIQCARSCTRLAECVMTRYDNASGTCLLLEKSNQNGTQFLDNSPQWITLRRSWYECDKGWSLFRFSCYFIPETINSWENSSNICTAYNGHLVTITSSAEQEFVVKLQNDTVDNNFPMWTGGRNVSDFGTWSWTWVTGESWSYEHWGATWPSGTNRYGDAMLCLSIRDSYWRDKLCERKDQSICEKSAVIVAL